MKFKARISFFGLLITAFVFAGCNIFSWSVSPEEGEDLLEEGLDSMFAGGFDAAESLFAEGLKEDSLNSDLLYNHAKATLLSSGESIVTILEEITKFSEGEGSEDAPRSVGEGLAHTPRRADDDVEHGLFVGDVPGVEAGCVGVPGVTTSRDPQIPKRRRGRPRLLDRLGNRFVAGDGA